MQMNRVEIIDLVKHSLSVKQFNRSLIYWHHHCFKQGTSIQIGPGSYEMPFDGMYVFVDLAPKANWAHPCLYLFIEDKEQPRVECVDSAFPPSVSDNDGKYTLLIEYGRATLPSDE